MMPELPCLLENVTAAVEIDRLKISGDPNSLFDLMQTFSCILAI
jgi:hypothetical protein